MNQQRRQFFQAVIGNSSPLQRILLWVFKECCFRPSGRIAATFTVLLLISCTSLTPERVNLLAAIAGQAAQIGAQDWLAKHPEHRQSFELIIAAIAGLVKQGETREFKYSELLQSLPVATLASTNGAVYVTGTSKLSTNKEQDRIIVYDEGTKKPYHVGGDIRVQRQIVAGLRRAMLPLPPKPAASLAGKPKPQLFTQTVALTNDGTLFRTNYHPTVWRTNVTLSVADVTHNNKAASMVSVSWVLGLNSVYHVEHSNEGTNWYRFASLTNTTATGQTNCCVVWPPTVPVGSWRVLRVR